MEQRGHGWEESPEKEVIILRYEANCDVRHAERRGRERERSEQPGSHQSVSPSLLSSPLSNSVVGGDLFHTL